MKTLRSYLFELSLEHTEFPVRELLALTERLGDRCRRISDHICIIETDRGEESMNVYSDCLAFTMRFSLLHGTYGSMDELLDGVDEVGRTIEGRTACIRVTARDKGTGPKVLDLQKSLGAVLSSHCPIRLEGPEREVRVVAEQGSYFLAVKLKEVDRRSIDSRQVKYRAFFSPVSLSPRYARGLLNLCGVSRGSRVLDPFCGTGGIVIESLLLGASTVGSDIDPRMIEGTRKNLEQLHLSSGWELHCIDVGRIGELGPFDVIVTDPPYGRSSYYNREDIRQLYARAMRSAVGCLKKGGALGIVVPDPSLLQKPDEVSVEAHLSQRVHKSLVRNYIVFRKKS